MVLPADGTLPPVLRNMMVIPLSYTEFSLACHDYPVVFVSGDQGKTAVAIGRGRPGTAAQSVCYAGAGLGSQHLCAGLCPPLSDSTSGCVQLSVKNGSID